LQKSNRFAKIKNSLNFVVTFFAKRRQIQNVGGAGVYDSKMEEF
jgi:hypothetical protein